MTLEEIQDIWKVDSAIDKTEISSESLRTPILHNKYMTFLSRENLEYKKYKHEYNILLLKKYDFYETGPTKETMEWIDYYPKGKKLLKGEIQRYLDADPDLIKVSLELSYKEEKVDYLKSIVKHIDNRNYVIKNYIEHEKFIKGYY